MDDANQPVLLLNRVPHELSMLLAQVKMAPQITVESKDIHPLPAFGGPAESLVEHRPETPEVLAGEIVLFKQNSGYTVLLGRSKVDALMAHHSGVKFGIQARLISTPALKKCRVQVQPREPMETLRSLDRGARTYHRDDSYQGNRLQIQRGRESDQSYFPQYDRQPRQRRA